MKKAKLLCKDNNCVEKKNYESFLDDIYNAINATSEKKYYWKTHSNERVTEHIIMRKDSFFNRIPIVDIELLGCTKINVCIDPKKQEAYTKKEENAIKDVIRKYKESFREICLV